MDVGKLVVGILIAAAITFLAWVLLVNGCNPCNFDYKSQGGKAENTGDVPICSGFTPRGSDAEGRSQYLISC